MKNIAVSASLSKVYRNLENPRIRFINWKTSIHFNNADEVPESLVLDLEIPGSLDIVCALREQFDSDALPIYGYIPFDNIKTRNLFLACGGTDIIYSLDAVPANTAANKTDRASFPLRLNLSRGETIRRLLDNLEKQTIMKDIASISGKTEVLSKTIELLLQDLNQIFKVHISVVLINNNQTVESYVMPSKGISRADYTDFLNFCLNDFFTHFKGLDMENLKEIIYIDEPELFNKIKIGTRKLSSYFYLPLNNPRGDTIGTIHFGHLSNNYFEGTYPALISELVNRMEPPLFLALKTSQNIIRQNKIFSIFSKFVPPEIIPDLITQEANRKKNKVQKKNITVLFSDIRSFTTITEENNAQQVVDFLNRHFDMMVGIIKKHGGTIDKFIGDAIVAVFGLSGDSEQINTNAVRAAIGMINNIEYVDCSKLTLPGDHYKIGIGIHHSEAIIGNIGSPDKSAFTAIGDVVGIAEELEGITKKYQKPILVSKKVFNAVKDQVSMETVLQEGRDSEWSEGLYSPSQEAYRE